MLIVLAPKDPGETIAYVADFTDQLGSDSIASYTLTVESGGATVDKQTQSVRSVLFNVKGGTNATTTVFLFLVTSVGGQIIERRYSVYVADNASSYATTSTTKRALIEQMYLECGMNSWELDITPEEKDVALVRLDSMMWELKGRGFDLGYNFPKGIGQGDLDDSLGCPDMAFHGLATLGALRLSPTTGKVSSIAMVLAREAAMKAVIAAARDYVPTSQLASGTPLGAGNRMRGGDYPFALTE